MRAYKLLLIVAVSLATVGMLTSCEWVLEWLNPQHLTTEEAKQILNTQSAGAEMFLELAQQGDPEATEKTLVWLKKQPNVENVSSTEAGNISILYTCGLPGAILTYSGSDNVLLSHTSPITSKPRSYGDSEGKVVWNRTSSSGSGGKNAIILLPFEHQFGTPKGIPALISKLRLIGYNVEGPVTNDDVTVDKLLSLENYNFIYIETHGIAHGWLLSHQIVIATGEPVQWYSLRDYWRALKRKGLEVISIPSGGEYFGVQGRLLGGYQYPGSLVIISACESFKNDTLANAFLDNGAKVFFGWTEKSCPAFSDIATYMLTGLITKPNFTIHDAYTTPVRVDIEPLHADWSIDALFPWTFTLTPENKKYKPDFKKSGDANFILNPAVYAESSSDLYTVDPGANGRDVHVGAIKTAGGSSPEITDIAWNQTAKSLYAISFETLYQIDPETCQADPVGTRLGVADVNALAFDASGHLYSATDTGDLASVDKSSGLATVIGSYGYGYESSGDLAFAPTGALFATVKEPGQSTDILVRVDLSTGKTTEIGDTGYRDVFGLFFVGDQLYGVSAENLLITIDTRTGYGSLVRQLSFSAWGAQSEEE